MEREWDSIKFTLKTYKSTNILVMVNNEPIWEIIEEHIMKTISICGSPYVEFMAKEMNQWRKGLLDLQDILDEWEKLQKNWQYLYPIFVNSDISKQLRATY